VTTAKEAATSRRAHQAASQKVLPATDREHAQPAPLTLRTEPGGTCLGELHDLHAELDQDNYPLGVRVSDRELVAVPLRRHDWHGEWNYTVLPAAAWTHGESTLSCGDPLLCFYVVPMSAF